MFLCFYGNQYYPWSGLGDLTFIKPSLEDAVKEMRQYLQEENRDLILRWAWAQVWQVEYNPDSDSGLCRLLWEWNEKTGIDGQSATEPSLL